MAWNSFNIVLKSENGAISNGYVYIRFYGNNVLKYDTSGYTDNYGQITITSTQNNQNLNSCVVNAFDLTNKKEAVNQRIYNIVNGNTEVIVIDCNYTGYYFNAHIKSSDFFLYFIQNSSYYYLSNFTGYVIDNDTNQYIETAYTSSMDIVITGYSDNFKIKIGAQPDGYHAASYIYDLSTYFDRNISYIANAIKNSYYIKMPNINDTTNWNSNLKCLSNAKFKIEIRNNIGVNPFLVYSAQTTTFPETSSIEIDYHAPSYHAVYKSLSDYTYSTAITIVTVSKHHYQNKIMNLFVSGNSPDDLYFVNAGETEELSNIIIDREPNVCMTNKDLYDYVVSLTGLRPDFGNLFYEEDRVGVSDVWFTGLWGESIKRYLPPEYQSMTPDTIEKFKTLFVNQLSAATVSTLYTYPEYLEGTYYRLDQHHGYVWDRCFIPEVKEEIVENYLTFSAVPNNTCKISFNYVQGPRTLFDFEYSLDSGATWNSYSFNQNGQGQIVTLSPGGVTNVKFRRALSNTGTTLSTDYYTYYYFSMTGTCTATGCVHSLLDGYGLSTTEFTSIGCFARLFANCNGLLTAPELPATSLTDYCYFSMFAGCTSLTSAPELPASSLTESCYNSMFANCTSLTTPPDLPATDLADSCYSQMFYNCTSLTTAPLLPAMILEDNCYDNMFANCTSLTNVQYYLPSEALADNCYNGMFQDCYSLTTAPLLPATTLTNNCYSNMFFGCSSLTNVQSALPATTLAQNCYLNMFNGCKSLTTAPILPAMTLADSCYRGMFQECSSLVSVQSSLLAASACQYCYAGMFSNCTSLITPPVVPATTLAENCYQNMFANCTSLTSTTYFPATTMKEYCYSGMFYGCTSLTNARTLTAATVLSESCFESMFYCCTSLTTAPTISRSPGMQKNCFKNMFNGCTRLTTMPYTGSSFPWQSHAYGCYEGMFENCTSLINTPSTIFGYNARDYCFKRMFAGCSSISNPITLYANNLDSLSGVCESMFEGCSNLMSGRTANSLVIGPNCYKNMFRNCGKLVCIEAKFTGTTSGNFTMQNASAYTYNWVDGVSSNGLFYHKSETPGAPGGYGVHWIPNGWSASLLP